MKLFIQHITLNVPYASCFISMQILYEYIFFFCFIYRKVEDLQFQIEEEAISKDDLEVSCC